MWPLWRWLVTPSAVRSPEKEVPLQTGHSTLDPPSLSEHFPQAGQWGHRPHGWGEHHCSLKPLLQEIPQGWGELFPRPSAPTHGLQQSICAPSPTPSLPDLYPSGSVSRSSRQGLNVSLQEPPSPLLPTSPSPERPVHTIPSTCIFSPYPAERAPYYNQNSDLPKEAGLQCLWGSQILQPPLHLCFSFL